MIVEHTEFRLRTGAGPDFEKAFADTEHLLLGAHGCRGAQLLPSVDHDDTYLLQVRWEQVENHTETFAATTAAAQLAAALKPHCDAPPRIVHYDTAGTTVVVDAATPQPAGDADLRARFREVMAGVPTPVSVVTSSTGVRPHGTTVSAFASLSMEPPMVLVSLDRRSDLLTVVRGSNRFGINVLAADQWRLALAFAGKGGASKFSGVPWAMDDGLPRLPGASGWLTCEVEALVDGGDHVVALGTVVAAEATGGSPLTYHGRVFGTHAALEE